MNKLTAKEIIDVLKEKITKENSGYSDSLKAFAYEEYDKEDLGLGEIKEVYQHGGEGQGDYWCSVKHFIDHDIYLEVVGYYQSHYGTDFEGWSSVKEVKPKEKTITVYE